MRRVQINLRPAERVARVAVGLAAAELGLRFLTSPDDTVLVVLEALLAMTGLHLVVTGVVGHCPVYPRLGSTIRPLRNGARTPESGERIY